MKHPRRRQSKISSGIASPTAVRVQVFHRGLRAGLDGFVEHFEHLISRQQLAAALLLALGDAIGFDGDVHVAGVGGWLGRARGNNQQCTRSTRKEYHGLRFHGFTVSES